LRDAQPSKPAEPPLHTDIWLILGWCGFSYQTTEIAAFITAGGRGAQLSATDTSPGDLTGLPCDIGFCHLTGPRISDNDAYGAGPC
jgi:hypothetical protein